MISGAYNSPREIDMAESKADASDIQAQIKQIGGEVTSLAATLKELMERTRTRASRQAGELTRSASVMAGDVGERIGGEIEELEHQIAKRPLQAAGIAFLLGILVATMARR
jgi:ElaB/YqjD/DUF883 family membrane-anchored ribosome-binding protein